MRSSTTLIVVLALALGGAGAAAADAMADGSDAGAVKFVKQADTSFNSFTEAPTAGFEAWMNQNFWRSEVFSPYFDEKTGWYPHGWVYKDLYALYPGSSYAASHEDWILRGAAGNRLYIPYGCANDSCPEYAADAGNAEFRHAWIAEAKAAIEKGYVGLWIDDVNLEFRVANGTGVEEAPIDPRTGQLMTEQAWQEYIVVFLEEIRQALPTAEIVHNSIWFAGGPSRWNNPLVQREIAAANYINLERGVNDGGLVGGDGPWSLRTLFSFIDSVHATGKGVVLDGFDASPAGREYSLASYLLISTGNDGVGLASMTPENWWPAYGIDLGTTSGPRYEWEGLLRRDFAGGIALVEEPGAASRTVPLPSPMLTTAGALVSAVTLNASEGAVLRYPAGSTYASVSEAGPHAPSPPSSGAGSAARPRVSLAERPARRRHRVLLSVRVRPARYGHLRISLQRYVKHRWRAGRVLVGLVGPGGGLSATLSGLRAGSYRVRALLIGAARTPVASSQLVRFRVRR